MQRRAVVLHPQTSAHVGRAARGYPHTSSQPHISAPRLASLVLGLRPPDDADIQQTRALPGKLIHGAFLQQIGERAPALADRLHRQPRARPFALAASWASERPGTRGQDPESLWLRWASTDEELTRALLDYRQNPSPAIGLGRWLLPIEHVHADPKRSVWGGTSCFDELWNNGIARARRDQNTIHLRFYTPTAFRLQQSGLAMPLPWPRLVFHSLQQRWNACAPFPIWINWQAFERSVSVSRHALETRTVGMGKHTQVGFVGDCTYLIKELQGSSLTSALHALAEFAFFAGVGCKTTMGMGLVRRADGRSG